MKDDLDALFVEVGDLLTGNPAIDDFYNFDRVYLRQFVLKELPLLHTGMTAKTRPHQHIIRAVQMCCNVDINQLTDGDFMYIMARLRKSSFPEFPVRAQYTCNNMVYVNAKNNIGFGVQAKDAKRLGFTLQPCGHTQSEIVPQTEIKLNTLEDDNNRLIHPKISLPRVGTLTDYFEHIDDHPRDKYVGDIARWLKPGKTFKAKLAYLMAQPDMKLFEEIEKVKTQWFHGVTEKVRLRCGQCNHVMFHESSPSMLSFFADNSDKDVYVMCYNLMSQFGVMPDMNMPVRMFLYHHSTLAADRREAEQKAKAQQNGGKPVMGTRRR